MGGAGAVADALDHTANVGRQMEAGGGESLAGQLHARERDAAVIADGLTRGHQIDHLDEVARRTAPGGGAGLMTDDAAQLLVEAVERLLTFGLLPPLHFDKVLHKR